MRLIGVTIENLRAVRGPVRLDGLRGLEVLHGDNNAGKSSVLLGISLALHLWEAQFKHIWRVGTGDPSEMGIQIELRAGAARLATHRSRSAEPVSVALELEGAPVARVAFSLRRAAAHRPVWMVTARWWPPGEGGEGHSEAPPVFGPDWSFIEASGASSIGPTYDSRLLAERRKDRSGEARRRFREVEQALSLFIPELGPGRLEEYQESDESQPQLAWIDESTDLPRPFSEEGSGLRSVKDIVVATFGSAASVILLEEPERHLSATAERRLRELMERLAATGRQLILTSHVHGFDGPGVWRLVRQGDEGVSATRDHGIDVPYQPVPLREDEERRLRRLYVDAGEPHVGYVSRDGITQLPVEILAELEPPTTVAWARRSRGVFGVITLAELHREDEEA